MSSDQTKLSMRLQGQESSIGALMERIAGATSSIRLAADELFGCETPVEDPPSVQKEMIGRLHSLDNAIEQEQAAVENLEHQVQRLIGQA